MTNTNTMPDLPPPPVELAVVLPTFNEKNNVEPLLEILDAALQGISYEVIFVDDDSPDGTSAAVREISLTNPRVRILQRIGRRGLSSACLEGMMATAAPYIAVMDADLQHDERILPAMLAKLKAERLDIVVGTRNAEGGSMGEFASMRVHLSNLGRRLSRLVAGPVELSDPMSGFFVLDRRFLEETMYSISGVGFKILLDLVTSSKRAVRVGEIPYHFRNRLRGESKLDILVGLEYLQLLLDKMIGDLIPPRFVIFSMVGAVGVVFSLILLFVLFNTLSVTFRSALIITTIVVMTLNFFLNNATTYRDRRLKGAAMWSGLLTFYAACSIGALINLRLAEFFNESGVTRYLAGLAGLTAGAVWNYGVTSMFTWRQSRERLKRRLPASPIAAPKES